MSLFVSLGKAVIACGADTSFIWLGVSSAAIKSWSKIPKGVFFSCLFVNFARVNFYEVELLPIHSSTNMPEDFPCTHPDCHRTFKRPGNRTQHFNAHHRPVSPDSEPDPAHQFRVKYHPKLNGMYCFILWVILHLLYLTALPCDKDGHFLPEHARPPPPAAPDATEGNTWHPFEDRLAFDWAHYHFTELQSSAREINKGLDLWLATTLKAGDDTPLPWSSAEEMYRTIDVIQEGDAPFETIRIKYTGPIRPNPPAWMTATYELCTRNSRTLLHHQLATTDFVRTFTPKPYRQFDHSGDRVWSDLMSGDYVWDEAVRI